MENQNTDTQTSSTDSDINNKPPHVPVRKNNNIVIVILCFVIVILVGVSAYLFGINQGKTKTNDQVSVVPTVADVQTGVVRPALTPSITEVKNRESYSEDTGVPNQKKYTSPKLGVSFLYLKKMTGSSEQILVKEIGNKIYLYSSAMQPESGQFLEVFSKESKETLEDALKKQFLSEKDPTRCFIEMGKMNTYPSSYVTAEIAYPADAEFDMESMSKKSDYCSPDYAKTNGIRYFLEDKNHPETYIFLSIGQYAISADVKQTWQDTIVFQ